MDEKHPRVSVLTVAGADRSLFHQTVQNLEAQSLQDFELVVVDRAAASGHPPLTWEDDRLRVVAGAGLSEDAAWNLGFENCRAPYVAILAGGHASRPVRLARQVDWLDKHAAAVLVGTASGLRQSVWETPPEQAHTDRDSIHISLLNGVEMTWSSLMLRRDATARLGPLLDEEFGEAARLNLCHRLCAVGDVTRIDEVLTLCPSEPGQPGPERLDAIRRALQTAFEPILGDDAERSATLVSRHLAGGVAVPDDATGDELEAVLARLERAIKPEAPSGQYDSHAAEQDMLWHDEPAQEAAAVAEALPRVSVVTVAGSDIGLLVQSIDSLREQSLRDFEVVIVVRGTPGKGAADSVWQDRRVRIVGAPGLTEDAAWNLGFAESRGTYVAMLGAGNVSRPARLARQAACLDRNPAVVLVGTASAALQSGGEPQTDVARTDRGVIAWLLHAGVQMAWSSLMIRRESIPVGEVLLREEYGEAARFEMCQRLCTVGDVTRIDEVLTLCNSKPGLPGAGRIEATQRVLEHVYAPIFGETAARTAGLIANHVAGYAPVPNVAVLTEIETALVSLAQWLKAAGKVDGVSRAMIAVERADLMNRLARQSRLKTAADPMKDRDDARGGNRLGAALGALWRGRAQPQPAPRWEAGRLS
jgi:hypothetical protein